MNEGCPLGEQLSVEAVGESDGARVLDGGEGARSR